LVSFVPVGGGGGGGWVLTPAKIIVRGQASQKPKKKKKKKKVGSTRASKLQKVGLTSVTKRGVCERVNNKTARGSASDPVNKLVVPPNREEKTTERQLGHQVETRNFTQKKQRKGLDFFRNSATSPIKTGNCKVWERGDLPTTNLKKKKIIKGNQHIGRKTIHSSKGLWKKGWRKKKRKSSRKGGVWGAPGRGGGGGEGK